MKKKIKKQETSHKGSTFVRAGAQDRRIAAADAGKNCHAVDLAESGLGKMLVDNYQSFSLADFIAISSSLDISYDERKQWFASFVEQQLKAGRIKEVPSCYNLSIYKVC